MTVREQLGRMAAEPLIDRLARGAEIAVPGERLDLRDYLDLALRSGFPEAIGIGGAAARQRWLRCSCGTWKPMRCTRRGSSRPRASTRLPGSTSTATSYQNVLENGFVVESLPAWRINRLKRLAQAPKRYVLDAGLMAACRRYPGRPS